MERLGPDRLLFALDRYQDSYFHLFLQHQHLQFAYEEQKRQLSQLRAERDDLARRYGESTTSIGATTPTTPPIQVKYHESPDNQLARLPLNLSHTHKHAESPITSVTYSWCGETIAASGGDRIELYRNKVQIGSLTHETPIHALRFAPDGTSLVAGGVGAIKVWDVQARQPRHHLPGSDVYSVATSPSGVLFASGSDDKIVHLWNLRNGRLVKTMGDHRAALRVHSLSFDASSARLCAGDHHAARVWDVEAGRLLSSFGSAVSALQYSSDSRAIVIGTTGGHVSAWDMRAAHTAAAKFDAHTGRVTGVAYAPCNRWVISSSIDHNVVFCDLRMGVAALQLNVGNHPLVDVAHNPRGRAFASAADDGRTCIWSYAD